MKPEGSRSSHLKLAFRQILRRPTLSGLVVIMLAVGIGATTAVYSLFHQVLIEPLPVHEPERLVNLSSPGFKPGSTWGSESVGDGDSLFTHEMFEDLAVQQDVLRPMRPFAKAWPPPVSVSSMRQSCSEGPFSGAKR